MTIRITLDDGNKQTTRTYREVYRHKNLAQYVENFYDNRDWCRWGKIEQLKGKERIVLHSFGEIR